MSKFRYRELRSVALGDLLGEGLSRKVYVCKLNSHYVVKIEAGGGSFQNIAEWDTWSWLSTEPAMARWLAPCEFISTCGMMLIQRRVEPIRRGELPKKLPAFLTDIKLDNFGMLHGKVVCCDYGTIGASVRRAPKRMVKAVWR